MLKYRILSKDQYQIKYKFMKYRGHNNWDVIKEAAKDEYREFKLFHWWEKVLFVLIMPFRIVLMVLLFAGAFAVAFVVGLTGIFYQVIRLLLSYWQTWAAIALFLIIMIALKIGAI